MPSKKKPTKIIDLTAKNLNDLRVLDLKAELKRRSLNTYGTKQELVKRLLSSEECKNNNNVLNGNCSKTTISDEMPSTSEISNSFNYEISSSNEISTKNTDQESNNCDFDEMEYEVLIETETVTAAENGSFFSQDVDTDNLNNDSVARKDSESITVDIESIVTKDSKSIGTKDDEFSGPPRTDAIHVQIADIDPAISSQENHLIAAGSCSDSNDDAFDNDEDKQAKLDESFVVVNESIIAKDSELIPKKGSEFIVIKDSESVVIKDSEPVVIEDSESMIIKDNEPIVSKDDEPSVEPLKLDADPTQILDVHPSKSSQESHQREPISMAQRFRNSNHT